MNARPTNDTPEQDFLRWRQHGDVPALGRVFDALAPELLIVAAHVADRGVAEDLVQTTFLQAITDGARWDSSRPLLPWLVGVLANLGLREREKARRQLDSSRVTPPAAAADPRDELERAELLQALGSALQGMPRHYRQVLTLRLVHGLEPAAIAHALGAPPATVKSRLQRGLDLLRRALPAGLRVPAFAVWTAPSLDAVRSAVLAHAKVHAAAAATTVTAASVGAATAAIGGALLMKKTMLAVVGVALAATLAVSLNHLLGAPASGAQPPVREAQSASAVSAPLEPTQPAASPEISRTAAAVEPPPAAVATPAAPGIHGRVVDESGGALADVLVFLGDKRLECFQNCADFLLHAGRDSGSDAIEQRAREVKAQAQRTDGAGAFTFVHPPNPSPHLLVAWAPERGCRGLDLPADRSRSIEIVLPHDPVVRGVVRNRADRTAVAGAAVHVWPDKSGMPIASAQADANGAYELQPLPPGAYRTSFQADGFAESAPPFDIAAGERVRELDVELESLPQVAVLLVDRADQPWTVARIAEATGARIRRLDGVLSERSLARRAEMESSWRVHRVQVDPDGHVRGFVREPKASVLTIWHGPEKLFEVPVLDFAATRLVVDMLSRTTIEVQVRVRFDPPAASAPPLEFAVVDPAGFGQDDTPLVTRTTTEAFCAVPVPSHFAGKDCGLVVKGDGYVPSYTVVAVPAQASGTWHEVTLQPPACTLRGVIVGPDGEPVPKASLVLADADGRWMLPVRLARRATALDGTFEIADLPRRRVRLFVAAGTFAPAAVELDTGDAKALRIGLQPARSVTVGLPAGVDGAQFRVLDGAGRPLADDRLNGTMRYGAHLPVGASAATIEAFDALTGVLLGSGSVPADGKLVLTSPAIDPAARAPR